MSATLGNTAMDVLPFIGLAGLVAALVGWAWFVWQERKENKARWGRFQQRLLPLGLVTELQPRLSRLDDGSDLSRFLQQLVNHTWQPESRVQRVRWLAQGIVDDRLLRMAEIELFRRRERNTFVESFAMVQAHWLQFCLFRRREAQRHAWESGASPIDHWKLLMNRSKVVMLIGPDGRAETLHSDRFLDDLDTLPGDEQWFVRGGWLTCHWSQPLNGDRPERMARRIDEFV